MATTPLFLQNGLGWKFFFEAREIAPGSWCGIVRIDDQADGHLGRMPCAGICSAQPFALRDAKQLAQRLVRECAKGGASGRR